MTTTAAAREVAAAIKQHGSATTAELAVDLDLSYETVRSHLAALAEIGLVESARAEPSGVGRPVSRWKLTRDGEHLFPKQYDGLAMTLLDLIASSGDDEAIDRTLAVLVDHKVAAWVPRLAGADLGERLAALTAIYTDDDPYISIEHDSRGVMLVERNCPFLDVAARHPKLCNLTIDTLSRLLGRRVVREATFQAGDGRCVFRITNEPLITDEPLAPARRLPSSTV